jgi:hypothetical protein
MHQADPQPHRIAQFKNKTVLETLVLANASKIRLNKTTFRLSQPPESI